jgi:hypothetical protein
MALHRVCERASLERPSFHLSALRDRVSLFADACEKLLACVNYGY